MWSTEKPISNCHEPAQHEVPPVANLSDDEVETLFEELVAQIDAEERQAAA